MIYVPIRQHPAFWMATLRTLYLHVQPMRTKWWHSKLRLSMRWTAYAPLFIAPLRCELKCTFVHLYISRLFVNFLIDHSWSKIFIIFWGWLKFTCSTAISPSTTRPDQMSDASNWPSHRHFGRCCWLWRSHGSLATSIPLQHVRWDMCLFHQWFDRGFSK